MLKDRKQSVERLAANFRLSRQIVQDYGAFLRTLFVVGDWFVTLTFRDRYQDTELNPVNSRESLPKTSDRESAGGGRSVGKVTRCAPDPRLATWEPDSRYRYEPGPPVRDAALREIEHWLLELGWEASDHTRQE